MGLLLLAGALLGGCAWLSERQREAVFRPSRLIPATFAGLRPGDESYFLSAGSAAGREQTVQVWWLPGADARAPTLLYLHGTFRNLYHNYPKMRAIRDAGFAVLGVEYRGWGESSPLVPSEDSIYADAEVGWRELLRRQPKPKLRVIYGHSMGGAVAVDLAAKMAVAPGYGGLILESTFTRAPDVAAATSVFAVPLAWLSGQRFDALGKISSVRAPILILHGTADKTVPYELGRRLFDAAGAPKTFVEFSGGSHSRLHDDAPLRYRSTLGDFAAALRLEP